LLSVLFVALCFFLGLTPAFAFTYNAGATSPGDILLTLDVLASAADRLAAYTGPSYTQYMQEGSSHQWVGYEPQLISHVKDWITVVAPPFTIFLPPILNSSL
jgi:hypothetical protein